MSWSDDGFTKEQGTDESFELAECQEVGLITCEGGGDVVGVLTHLVGGVAQAFHDDRVVELRVQLGVEDAEGKRQGRRGRSRKGEASQRGCAMDDHGDESDETQDLSQ